MELTESKPSDIIQIKELKHSERRREMKANRKKLEMAMARLCMNSEDLQKAAGIPRATLNNVISGRSVRPGTMGRVCKALEVDVTEIIED